MGKRTAESLRGVHCVSGIPTMMRIIRSTPWGLIASELANRRPIRHSAGTRSPTPWPTDRIIHRRMPGLKPGQILMAASAYVAVLPHVPLRCPSASLSATWSSHATTAQDASEIHDRGIPTK